MVSIELIAEAALAGISLPQLFEPTAAKGEADRPATGNWRSRGENSSVANGAEADSPSALPLRDGTPVVEATAATMATDQSTEQNTKTAAPLLEEAHMTEVNQLEAALSEMGMKMLSLFKRWDKDEDGTISRSEFRKVLPELGIIVKRPVANALFARWDRDDSGEVQHRAVTSD